MSEVLDRWKARFERAKQLAVDHVDAFAAELWRGEQRHKRKHRWNLADPFRPDAKAHNCSLDLGRRRGAFQDFESGLKGDALDFVAHGLTGRIDSDSRKAAVMHIEQRFGLSEPDPAEARRIEAEAKARRAAAEAAHERKLAENRTKANGRFHAALPIDGSLAETYLAARGISLAAVPNRAPSLRFLPDAEWWMGAVWQEDAKGRARKVKDGPHYPAMISAMVDRQGRIAANHFTFLKADGSGKAGTIGDDGKGKDKLMYPDTYGLVIRVTNGASALGAEKAAQAGQKGLVALTEGIEDALSVASLHPDLRCWAAGSLSGLMNLPDHDCAAGFLIFMDNDWGKPGAQKQFCAAVSRLKSFGKPVEVVSMPEELGKDVNDAIRA